MSATYDPSLSTPRDRLRYLLGDTATAAPFLQDETYEATLQQKDGDERAAGLFLVAGLLARYAQMPDQVQVEGGANVKWSNILTSWKAQQAAWVAEVALVTAETSGIVRPVSTHTTVKAVW